MSAHETVLLHEAVDGLIARTDGTYVDGTFGRGGHSKEILKRLDDKGCLLGVDKDPQAIATGEELARQDSRFQILQGSFADTKAALADRGIESCLLYTSPSPRDATLSRMPSSA